MFRKENQKTTKKTKIILGAAIAIIAIITAIVAILMANNQEKTRKTRKVSDPELARAMTYDQFEDGDENIDGTDNVKFSAFFLRDVNNDGYAEKIKGTCKQIGKEDTLYMEVKVQTEGILKNGKIEIDGKNFYLVTAAPKDNELKDNYVSINTKTMEFSDLNNGTQKLITGLVRSGDYAYTSSTASAIGSNVNNLSRNDNKIIFTGTYVSADNTETEIRKEINLSTDWYGITTASLEAYNTTHYDIQNNIDQENGTIAFDVDIRTRETKYLLNINQNYLEGTIPQLNGYDPISVTTTSSNTTFNYDEATRKFTLTREATLDTEGNLASTVSRDNYYKITIKYPLEAYTSINEIEVKMEIPVMTYYEGYNNPNTEFTNPYKSNEAKSTLIWTFRGAREYETSLNVTVGDYVAAPTYRYLVSKNKPLKIYNGQSEEETNDTYNVKWYVSKGTSETTDGIIMKETQNGAEQVSDQFVKTDSTKDSMENLTTNVGISIANADNFLAEDGWIKIYDDETDNLLVTFTKTDWNKYTTTSPYKFTLPVKHIRVETSQTQPEQYITVTAIKELDDEYITTNYTKEQFAELQYINSQLCVYSGEKLVGTRSHSAHYQAPYSVAELNISKSTLSTQMTEKNAILTIRAYATESQNQQQWKNGSFLVKMPKDILATEINNITSTNSSVTITSYEYIENDNGKFIKINTQNTTDAAQTFNIEIDANLTPDPRIATQTESFELYATNEDATDYCYSAEDIYDVNDNLNTTEKVHKSTLSISLVSPNSLLTNQTASNFDQNGTQVVSPQIADVKPPLATVDQNKEEKTLTIGAQIKNNYSSTISEVKLLGKIPFEGNTYVISGENLKSTFTTKMTNAGIQIPEELKDKIAIYYSDNENPDKDTAKASNNWKTADQIDNWDNIKTYLIDFQDYELATGEEYTFYYTIKVPNGIAYNKVAYSHHGVYFALNTPEGKYRTQTEPNKLGIRIAEKYSLEIQKYQANKTNLVPGATYKITKEATDETEEETKTAVTNAEGKLTIDNLYAENAYTIEEIKVPENYELNTDKIKFTAHVQEDGTLQIDKTEGTTRENITVEKEQNGEEVKSKVIIKLEDEAKAKLKIIKTDKTTTAAIRGIRFKLTGTGLPEKGKIVTTNINGEITITGLKIGEEYTLEETKATGYYLTSPVKFTITNEDGTYTANITEGETKSTTVTEEENIPVINMNIEDEKIPTYDLEIAKIKKLTSVTEGDDGTQQEEIVYLQGAKFKLYKGTKELGSYITDENGKITISNLYQYIDGKDEEATYMLKETLAPDGYAKVKDITFKVDGSTGELKFINTEGKEEKYTVEGTTVKLTIEDSPSFKLIKKDAETGERLANIKFAIYDVEDGTVPAKNSKGEILGTKETINGKEYYTVTTDSNGELTADLPEGMYKAVEVQAPDKYDISDSTYYFGIGASREGKEGVEATWAQEIGNSSDVFNSISNTSDGGYIIGGYFYGTSIDLGNGLSLINNNTSSTDRAYDGMIIKYNSEGTAEWARKIGGTDSDYVNSVAETSDGGYIVGGYFYSKSIDLGNGITLTRNKQYDGMVIKYDENGEAQWAQTIGGEDHDYIYSVAATDDGGCLAVGSFTSKTILLENGDVLTRTGTRNGMMIKYNADGTVEWGKSIVGTGSSPINTAICTKDDGYIIGGYFTENIELDNGESIITDNNANGIIIKYDQNMTIEWVQRIEEKSYINSIDETADGEYIVGGYFNAESLNIGNEIVLNKTNKHASNTNSGMIIKYNEKGEPKWGNSIGYMVNNVMESSDGGCIIVGDFFNSQKLKEGITITSKDYTDGVIVKYSSNGEVKWAQSVGGKNSDEIKSVAELNDGSYMIIAQIANEVDLGNGIKLKRKTGRGLIAKFKETTLLNPVTISTKKIGNTGADTISSVKTTNDGGYIVGGFFTNNTIDVGNGVTITNENGTYKTGMIIKYNSNEEAEWAKAIQSDSDSEIISIEQCNDNGYVAIGYYSSDINLGHGIEIKNTGNKDGLIIKYNSIGEIEWAQEIGGNEDEYLYSIEETKDGGYIVGGSFKSNTIMLEDGTTLENKNAGYNDGMVLKYSQNGKLQWTKTIGGNNDDQVNSVIETNDNGYIVGGKFKSNNIKLENGTTIMNNGQYDGMIVKYNEKGNAEWAQVIGGTKDDTITSLIETEEGKYIIAGSFESSTIALSNDINLETKNSSVYSGDIPDGFIVKYSTKGKIEWAKVVGGDQSDEIKKIIKTNDGGFAVSGRFKSSGLDLGSITLKAEDNYFGRFRNF